MLAACSSRTPEATKRVLKAVQVTLKDYNRSWTLRSLPDDCENDACPCGALEASFGGGLLRWRLLKCHKSRHHSHGPSEGEKEIFPNDWENVSSCRERVRFSGALCGHWWACNCLWSPRRGEGWAGVAVHALVGLVLWRRDRRVVEVAVAPCGCKGGWTASTSVHHVTAEML